MKQNYYLPYMEFIKDFDVLEVFLNVLFNKANDFMENYEGDIIEEYEDWSGINPENETPTKEELITSVFTRVLMEIELVDLIKEAEENFSEETLKKVKLFIIDEELNIDGVDSYITALWFKLPVFNLDKLYQINSE